MKVTTVIILAVLNFAGAVYKIDVPFLRCLVCKASIKELNSEISKIDPAKRMPVGGYVIDDKGNFKQKTVSQATSEVTISELIETICDRMDDYVRATWKSNGQFTILKMVENGQMNPDMSKVDFIQDDDLNKSLKYYCEGILEEFEEDIVKYYKSNADDIGDKICRTEAHLCKAGPDQENYAEEEADDDSIKDEL